MNSPHNNASRVLRAAAGYIAAHGYHRPSHPRDNYCWTSRCAWPAASDVGAIAFVVYGEPVDMPTPEPTAEFKLFRQAVNAYVDWLELADPEGTGIVSEPTNAADLADAFNQAASLYEARNKAGRE